jgi:hypothetical protein
MLPGRSGFFDAHDRDIRANQSNCAFHLRQIANHDEIRWLFGREMPSDDFRADARGIAHGHGEGEGMRHSRVSPGPLRIRFLKNRPKKER